MKNSLLKTSINVGFYIGVAYFFSTLILFWPSEELFLLRTVPFRIHFFIYSLAFWMICFFLMSMFILFILRMLRINRLNYLSNFLFVLTIALFISIGYGIYFLYFYNIPPHYPSYLIKGEVFRTLILCVAISLTLSFIIALFIKAYKKGDKLKLQRITQSNRYNKAIRISFILLALYFVSTSTIGHIDIFSKKAKINPVKTKVFILGIDAASWNILIPLIKDGSLTNFEKLLDNSAYGYFDTYGEQFTPKVWASIVTGKTPEKHSISSFSHTIYNWSSKPLWEILSDNGDKVGVVNWMNAFPAVPINGFMFSEINEKMSDQYSIKFVQDFDIPEEELLVFENQFKSEMITDRLKNDLLNELNNSKRILQNCNDLNNYRLMLFYILKIDSIQHFLWSDFNDNYLLNKPKTYPNNGRNDELAACWQQIDKLIGVIKSNIDDNTIFCIISDHGARAIYKKEIVLKLKKILDTLNYRSSFISVFEEELIEVSNELDNKEFAGLYSDLTKIKLWPSGQSIFKEVLVENVKEKRLIKLKIMRSLKKNIKEDTKINLNGKLYPYNDYFELHPWEGRHRARGVIVLSNRDIKQRYLGSWIVDSPYFCLFRLLHGRISILDKIYPFLKVLHLVDPITTLDITPTILNLLEYPIAIDMDGKDFSSMFFSLDEDKVKRKVETYCKSKYFDKTISLDKDMIRRLNDELKALGYIK